MSPEAVNGGENRPFMKNNNSHLTDEDELCVEVKRSG